jgi:hypothetical protein
MVEDIFQRPSTTLNGYYQSITITRRRVSSYHSNESIHISYRQSISKTTIRRIASERIAPDGGQFTTTYTALTLRGARGSEAGINCCVLVLHISLSHIVVYHSLSVVTLLLSACHVFVSRIVINSRLHALHCCPLIKPCPFDAFIEQTLQTV